MKNEKTCCIITNDFCNFNYLNQSEAKKEKQNIKIKEEICRLITTENVTKFISGLEAGIDLYSAEFLLGKENVSLEGAAAYEEQSASYSEKERDKYFKVTGECDKFTLVNRKRDFGCKNKRDRYMIENSDFIICFWDKISPYTGELLQYAVSLDKKISYI